jgi:hypothetical protein
MLLENIQTNQNQKSNLNVLKFTDSSINPGVRLIWNFYRMSQLTGWHPCYIREVQVQKSAQWPAIFTDIFYFFPQVPMV